MSNPTPSPRPAALVIAMATQAGNAFMEFAAQPNGMHDPDGAWEAAVEAALTAAHTAGFVLIPRAELEEAAEHIETDGGSAELVSRLRQGGRG